MGSQNSQDRFDPRSPFTGPSAENAQLLRRSVNRILDEVISHRRNPRTVKGSAPAHVDSEYFENRLNHAMNSLTARLQGTVDLPEQERLTESERKDLSTVECWSDRYIAHMLADGTIPAVLGRLLGDLTWQNNVYQDVSTVTTFLEHEAVATLAHILGYTTPDRPMDHLEPNQVYAGGRITSGGTVANAEALWIMREKSFAALGLFSALSDLNLLDRYNKRYGNEADQIVVAEDVRKDFWGITDRCKKLFQGHDDYLTAIDNAARFYRYMYTDRLSRVDLPRPVYITSIEAHYSINKNIGLLGGAIPNDEFLQAACYNQQGSRQEQLYITTPRYDLWFVDVDKDQRMSMDGLLGYLDRLARQKPEEREEVIVGVIPTLGTTEPCVFDPLHEILEIRAQYFRQYHLWFYVHADAAWGGMLRLVRESLPEQAKLALDAIGQADSCTIDPHKLAYIPYPAGALVLRERRDRTFIDIKANYLPLASDAEADTQIGIASIEGSKPGSAAMACWLTFLSMTSEDVTSPADALKPCDLYIPILERSLQNTRHLAQRLLSLGTIRIVHPVEGNLICFQVLPQVLGIDIGDDPLKDQNTATSCLIDHFNQIPPSHQRSFIVSDTKIARTKLKCLRVTLMNPYITTNLLDEFAERVQTYLASPQFRVDFKRYQDDPKGQ